jgi:hypothetical protein
LSGHPATTRAAAGFKDIIVRLALGGWLPFWLADWLVQAGGLRHE